MATVTPILPTVPAAFARTVHTVAATVRTTYPSLGGKVDHATALVLAGAVEPDDRRGPQAYTVASQQDAFTFYEVLCGTPPSCTCEDFTRHGQAEPTYQCKHILATWIYRRTLAQHPPEPVASAVACPEASFSLCLRDTLAGQDAQLTVRGQTKEEFLVNVEAVRGLLEATPTPARRGRQPPQASRRRRPRRERARCTPVC